MRPHRTAAAIAAVVAAASALAGCGEREFPTITDPPTSSVVVVEPVRVEGGVFVEGFVAGTDIDGREGAIVRMAPLDAPVEATVTPGSRDVRVLVYPCEAACRPWSEFAERFEAELAKPGERLERLEALVTWCRDEVVVDPGAELHVTPVIDVRDVDEDGPSCAFELDEREPSAAEDEPPGPAASAEPPTVRVLAVDVRGSSGRGGDATVTIDPDGSDDAAARPLGDAGLRTVLEPGEHLVRIEIGTGPTSSVTCDEHVDVEPGDALDLLPILESDAHAARCRIERRSTTAA